VAAVVKHPGGGRFDRDAASVYFFAGSGGDDQTASIADYTLIALNDIMGKGGETVKMEARMDAGGRVFLDSGVFNLANQHAIAHGMPMDEALGLHPDELDGFGPLRAAYVDTVKTYEDRLWGYVELDQGGADRKRETRAGLEAEGIVPIPVYHPFNDGWDYFDELASEYDRICIGNVVQASYHVRKRILSTIWERHRDYPHVWLHLLGLTPNEIVGTLPFESCDSSSFVYSLRFGAKASPYALSAGKQLARADAGFSYDTGAGSEDGSLERAVALAHAATHHLSRCWHAQLRAAAELCPPLPPREPWEPPLHASL
jgi:hypothetical protein